MHLQFSREALAKDWSLSFSYLDFVSTKPCRCAIGRSVPVEVLLHQWLFRRTRDRTFRGGRSLPGRPAWDRPCEQDGPIRRPAINQCSRLLKFCAVSF